MTLKAPEHVKWFNNNVQCDDH